MNTTDTSSSALPPPPLQLALPRQPTRPLARGSGPRATLPPALLDRAAAETPALRCNKPAAAVSATGRKKSDPALPPSGKGAKKPKTARHTPWASRSSTVGTATAERKRALEKKVAGCLLTRSWAAGAAWRQEGQTALRCLCLLLPRGSSCALHQDDALGRSWMEEQKGGVPPVGGDGEMLVPMVRAGDGAQVFAEYVRWRKNVRMPSRFYMEHVRATDDRQED